MKKLSLALAAVIWTLSSCSPIASSPLKNKASNRSASQPAASDDASSIAGSSAAKEQDLNAVDGDWVCATDLCTYQEIFVSLKDDKITMILPQDRERVELAHAKEFAAAHLHVKPGSPDMLTMDSEQGVYARKPAQSAADSGAN